MNPKTIPITVEGVNYDVMWQDFGSFKRLNVFQNNKRIGYRDMPIRVGTETRMIVYFIKSILKGELNGLNRQTLETKGEAMERTRKKLRVETLVRGLWR